MNERFEQLVSGLVLPLVLGGKIKLSRPFGMTALTVGQNERLLDPDARTNMDVARVRQARLLAPVDVLPELTTSDWAIAAVLNDVLQITNHHLGGTFTMSRYGTLIQSVLSVCTRIPWPRNVGEALARHATFARVLDTFRTDTSVDWWTGSARFRGEEPSPRLLVWRNLRRVRVDTERVSLTKMASDIAPVDSFHHALSAWLHLSPITDLATIARDAPAFVWSPATISLIAVPSGRTLAYRALCRANPDIVTPALNHARKSLLPQLSAQQQLVDEFSAEVADAFKRHHISASA